jgi:hypothetical protein
MIRKALVAVAAFVTLALASTIPPTTASAKELTGSRSHLPCATKKLQKLRTVTPPPQRGENRRAPTLSPPKTLKGKPMW